MTGVTGISEARAKFAFAIPALTKRPAVKKLVTEVFTELFVELVIPISPWISYSPVLRAPALSPCSTNKTRRVEKQMIHCEKTRKTKDLA